MSAFYKHAQGKNLCGVCAGLAESYNTEAELIRLLFAALALFWGLGVFVYLFFCFKLKEKAELKYETDQQSSVDA